jgi:hypothetical protein
LKEYLLFMFCETRHNNNRKITGRKNKSPRLVALSLLDAGNGEARLFLLVSNSAFPKDNNPKKESWKADRNLTVGCVHACAARMGQRATDHDLFPNGHKHGNRGNGVMGRNCLAWPFPAHAVRLNGTKASRVNEHKALPELIHAGNKMLVIDSVCQKAGVNKAIKL